MSGHTPGPWAVSAYLSSRPDQIRKNYVSAADGINGNWRLFVTEGPDAEANAARIVACVNACEGINPDAAPELFEACEGLVAATSEYLNTGSDQSGYAAMIYAMREAVAKARAAIAKARGQA